jgi:cobalt/nickel transport protein
MEKTNDKNSIIKNIILIILVILLAVIPLVFVKNGDFSGADDKAKDAITEIKSDYKPWFNPLWEPPSGEIESLLFALQAALGSGFVCYYIGYVIGKSKGKTGKA